MNKKLLLPLIGILCAFGVKTVNSQCLFTVRENVSDLSNSHITNLATCSTYTVTYTIKNTTGSNIHCRFQDTIHLPDSIYSSGPITAYFSDNGAVISGTFTNTFSPIITIDTTTTAGDNWNVGDSITFTFQIVTPCCLPATSSQYTLMRLSNACTASPPNQLTLIAPQFFVNCNYPGTRTAYENIGSVVDLVFEVKNNTIDNLPINQYVNVNCPHSLGFMKMLGYFFSTTQNKSLDTNNTYCNFDTIAGFVRPNEDTLIQATSLTYNSLYGTNYFPNDSTFYIHILYQVKECTPAGADSLKFILFCASGGSNPTCYPGQPVTAYINVLTGTPKLLITLINPVYIDSANANYCDGSGVSSVNFGFIVKNNGTEQSPGAIGNAYADSIKLFFQVARELGVIDTTSFRINGYLIADTLPKLITKTSTVLIYELDLSRYHYYCTLPFGLNSLADINGRGSLDDLSDIPGANTFTITVNYEYSPYPPSCPPSFSTCGGTDDNPLYASTTYQNQCGVQMPNYGVGYVYEAKNGGDAQLNDLSGHDIVEPTSPPFYLQLCPGTYKQEWSDTGYHFICPKADDRIILKLPSGFQVDFSDATVFNPVTHYFVNPVIITPPIPAACGGCVIDSVTPHVYQLTSTVTCDTNEAIIDFGNIKQCDCSNEYHQTYNISCFKIPLTLICNGCSSVSRGWDNISYTLAYFCDTSTCSFCGSQLACANTSVLQHCSGTCTAGNDFESHAPFTFRRQTLGWIDTIPSHYYSYLNPPKLNVDSVRLHDPWIRLDRAYPGDEILASDSARLDTTFGIFDSIIFQINYTTSAWIPGHISSQSIFDFDNSNSYVEVRDTFHHSRVLRFPTLQRSDDRILADSNVQMSFTFKADSTVDTLLKGLSPPYYLISHIFLIAKDSPQNVPNSHNLNNFYYPGQYPLTHLEAQWRGNYATYPLDTDNSCDPWTADFTILEPDVYITLSGASSTCAQYTESLTLSAIPACAPDEDFPYEFRPFAILDSNIILVAPPSCTYDSSQISVYQDRYNVSGHNNFWINDSVKDNLYHERASWVGSDTIKYNIHDSNCIPFFDCRNYLSSSGVIAYLQPSCNSPDTAIFALTGLTTSIQQLNPAYRVHKNYNLRLKTIHTNPILQISLPTSTSLCSDSVTFTITLSNNDNLINAPYPWIALEQSNHLAPPVIFTTVTNALYSDTYNGSDKFIMLDSLPHNTGRTITITAIVDTSHGWGCVSANTTYSITILSGNDCTDFTDSMHVPDPHLGCFDTIATYDFDLFPSSLSLSPIGSIQIDSIDCSNRVAFNFDLKNSGENTLTAPEFFASLPPGIILDSAVFVYPALHDVFTTDDNGHDWGNLIWNLTRDTTLKHGFPGSCTATLLNPDTVNVSIYIHTTCGFVAAHNSFTFHSSGISPCNQLIKSDSVKDQPTIPVVDSACCAPKIPLCVPDTAGFDLVIDNRYSSTLSSSIFFHEKILVIDTFTVDKYTFFSDCDVQFAPNARINIVNNDTLQLDAIGYVSCNHFHAACDTMWDGIYIYPGSSLLTDVHPLIEDAKRAVVSINSPTQQGYYFLRGITFNKCYQDIIVKNCSTPYTGKLENCIFTCRNLSAYINTCSWYFEWKNAPFDTLLPPYLLPYSKIGIDIENVDSMTVSGADTFDNLQFGIKAFASNLTVNKQNLFENIGFRSGKGVGVYDTGTYLGHNTLTVDSNTFLNCKVGVFATHYLSNVKVDYNTIYDSNSSPGNYGVIVTQMDYVSNLNTLYIEEDTITNFIKGIAAGLNTYVNANINYNTIQENICGIQNWTGIAMNEAPSPNTIYTVDENKISVLNYGITATGLDSSNINLNTINLGILPTTCSSSQYIGDGIGLKDCANSQIDCNVINAPSYSTVYPNAYTGIFVSQTTQTTVIDDTITSPHIHIEFVGNNTAGDNLFDNVLTTGDTGIYKPVGTAMAFMGSNTQGTDDTFSGINCKTSTPFPFTAKYFISAPLSYSPYLGCPGPTSDPSGRPHISDICPTVPLPPSARSHSMVHHRNDSTHLDSATVVALENTALSIDTFYVLQDTNMVIQKEGALSTIWRNQYLLSDSILRKFNDSMSNASMGQILAIDTSMVSVSSIDYSSLLNNLNSIIPANNIEANLQTAISGYLTYRMTDSLSINELAILRTLADKCPDWDGNAVYKARALLSLFDPPETVYSDLCGSNQNDSHKPNKRKSSNQTTLSTATFRLYPNPNNGNFTLEYNLGENETGKVKLFNTVGEQIGEYALNGSEGKMNISNPELSNGVYIWKLYSNAQIVKYGKVIIIK